MAGAGRDRTKQRGPANEPALAEARAHPDPVRRGNVAGYLPFLVAAFFAVFLAAFFAAFFAMAMAPYVPGGRAAPTMTRRFPCLRRHEPTSRPVSDNCGRGRGALTPACRR